MCNTSALDSRLIKCEILLGSFSRFLLHTFIVHRVWVFLVLRAAFRNALPCLIAFIFIFTLILSLFHLRPFSFSFWLTDYSRYLADIAFRYRNTLFYYLASSPIAGLVLFVFFSFSHSHGYLLNVNWKMLPPASSRIRQAKN